MTGTQNRYMVTWDLQVHSQNAIANINAYTHAVREASRAMRSYNAQMTRMKKMGATAARGGGVATAATAGASSAATAGAIAGSKSVQASKSGSVRGARTQRPTQFGRGAVAGAAMSGRGFQSPLRGTPFGGLMGTLLAFSAISSQAQQAAEYGNVIETAKAILKIADDDLSTFEDRFQSLSTNVRQIGLDTKFTAAEVADATRYLAMAGLDMKSIDESMRPIADLATIGDEDLAKIADLTTNIMTGFGIDSSKMRDVADIITSTMSRANVSITEIAESYKMASGYLSSAGVDFSEATAAIGVLGDAGMKATLAGTALRSMIIRFAKPSKQAQEMLDSLGVSFTRTVGEGANQAVKLKPLVEIFTELGEKGATLEQLQTIFGMIGGNAALQLTNRVAKLSELTAKNAAAHGLSMDVAMKKQETIVGKWAQFTSALQETVLRSFLISESNISGALGSMTDTILSQDFTEGLSKLMIGLTQVLETAVSFGSWIASNWSWIQPLVVGRFIHKNIMNFGRGLVQIGGTMKSMLGTASSVGSAVGGWVTLGAAAISYMASLHIEAEMLAKANDRAYDRIIKDSPTVYSSLEKLGEILKANRKEVDKTAEGIKVISGLEMTDIDSKPTVWSGLLNSIRANIVGTGTLLRTSNAKGELDNTMAEHARELAKATYQQQDAYTSIKFRGAYDDVVGRFIQSLGRDNLLEYTQDRLDAWISPYREKYLGYDRDDTLYDKYGVLHPGIGDEDPRGADVYLYTDEFKESFGKSLSDLSSSINIWAQALTNADDGIAFFKELVGSENINKLASLGVSMSDGIFTLPARGDDPSWKYDGKIDSISAIISNSIRESAKLVPPEVFQSVLKTLNVPEHIWKLGGATKGGVDINKAGITGDVDDPSANKKYTQGLSATRTQTRQVIINIDNMLRIDDVQIDNHNGEGYIADIKEHLTQALLDVVGDASTSYL